MKKKTKTYAKRVAVTVLELRKDKGFTQAAFAKALGITANQLWMMESGKGLWRLDRLKKATSVLGITMVKLFKLVEAE